MSLRRTGPEIEGVRVTPTVGDLRRALADAPDDQPLKMQVTLVREGSKDPVDGSWVEVDVDARSWGATIRVEVEL